MAGTQKQKSDSEFSDKVTIFEKDEWKVKVLNYTITSTNKKTGEVYTTDMISIQKKKDIFVEGLGYVEKTNIVDMKSSDFALIIKALSPTSTTE